MANEKANAKGCRWVLKRALWVGVIALSLSAMLISPLLVAMSSVEHAPHGNTCPPRTMIGKVADELRRLVRFDDEEEKTSQTRLADEVRRFETSSPSASASSPASAPSPSASADNNAAAGTDAKQPFDWHTFKHNDADLNMKAGWRMRKDWADLTDPERVLYFKAVNLLKSTTVDVPDVGPKSMYDVFVIIHGDMVNKDYAHQSSGFLAWHRKFLLEYETALRSLGDEFKHVTVPYWDWSAETFECTNNQDFTDSGSCETYHASSLLLRDFGGPGSTEHSGDDFSDKVYGSSASGAIGCVMTGPFAGWEDHNGKCLSRGVNWKISDQLPFVGRVRLAEIIGEYGSFGNAGETEGHSKGFRDVMETMPHGATHNYLGGHMRSFISPADPIFWSHHAYLDKVWATWQDCHGHDTQDVKDHLVAGDLGEPGSLYAKAFTDTAGKEDKSNQEMMFNLMIGAPAESSRATPDDPECGGCVANVDDWCGSNDWDSTCQNMCTDVSTCAADCGYVAPPTINMNTATGASKVFAFWDQTEFTPGHLQSTHLLGSRSYTYAPDEFERHLEVEVSNLMCKTGGLDSHKNAQEETGSLLEAQRFHHSCTPRGEAAYTYANMIKKAFNNPDAVAQNQQFAAAKTEECKAMGKGIQTGEVDVRPEFKDTFNCKANPPRFWEVWIGNKKFEKIMHDEESKHDVFQDWCCRGDEKALEPGPVKGGGCDCHATWDYKGVTYEGCERTADLPEAEKAWCYIKVSGECPAATLKTTESGEKLKWRTCKPNKNGKETAALSGKKFEKPETPEEKQEKELQQIAKASTKKALEEFANPWKEEAHSESSSR